MSHEQVYARQLREDQMKHALDDITAERERQIEVEGWTHAHDDAHTEGEMANAAACYAAAGRTSRNAYTGNVKDEIHNRFWPWSRKWWKPTGGARRCLVKAGALIVAEIERLDRSSQRGQ